MLPQYNSQLCQDEIVYNHFFRGKLDGVYLDIGAHDGVQFSNSKFFDDLGWKGMCVEANPKEFANLCKNRPNAINVYGAAYDRNGTVKFRVNDGWTSQLSGIEEAYHPSHIDRVKNELVHHGGATQIIDIPCFKVADKLIENKITSIDYMSLDVEGAELQILKTIPFERVQIKVINVEDNYNQEAEYDAILLPLGYKKMDRLQWDLIYYKS
jgi:FkbM family methyltransferase